MVDKAAMTASLATRVVRRSCSGVRTWSSCIDLHDLSGPGKLRANGPDSPSDYRVCDHAQTPLQETVDGELPGRENPDVPEVPGQAGADSRRRRHRKVPCLWLLRGRLSS